MSKQPSLFGPARDRASRGDIAVHDHVCGIYDTREAQYEPAYQFLKAGLERNEQCLYITEMQTPADFITLLESKGLNVKDAARHGSLQVLSGKEVRAILGGFTPEAMLLFLSTREQLALNSGFTAFRWGAEMTWLRQDNIDPVQLVSFEAELNRFLKDHQLTGLCQYARDDFNAELLIAAAETHPLLVYNDVVCDNFYFVPPEEYLQSSSMDTKLNRMLFNIISRERLMYKLLS